MDKDNRKTTYIIVTVAAILLIGLIMIVSRGVSDVNKSFAKTKASQAAKKEEPAKPKADTSDLNLSVNKSIYGIEITNNEDKNLENCKVTLNGKWATVSTLVSKQLVAISWGQFQKRDGERFNIAENGVKSVLVSECKDMPARINLFGS